MRTLIALLIVLAMVIAVFEYGYGPHRPKYIYANGIYFPIYYSKTKPSDLDKEAEDRREKDESIEALDGLTICSIEEGKSYIQINPYQSFEEMQDTLWHEAKHAANKCDDLPVGGVATYDDIYEIQNPEELRLLKDNPRLLEFITAEKSSWLK